MICNEKVKYEDDLVRLAPLKPPVEGGFTLDNFTVDESADTVTHPALLIRPTSTRRYVIFGVACRACPQRQRCTAIEVPGSGSLNEGGGAQVNSVSCASAGNCAADGFYTDSSRHGHAFVVSERPSH
jgi:hypothetical protein